MITILADEGKNQIGAMLHQELLSQGADAAYISLENVEVKPCTSCEGCTYKTYGRCVVRDDGDWIYPKVIQSDVVVFVTPIVFGSYSFKVKRVFDKFALVMNRHYFVESDELVKCGMLGRQFKLFSIGVCEDCTDEEADHFKRLFHENMVITRGAGKAYITGPALTPQARDEIVREVMNA